MANWADRLKRILCDVSTMKCQSQRKRVGCPLALNSWLEMLFSQEVNQHDSEGMNLDCDLA